VTSARAAVPIRALWYDSPCPLFQADCQPD
jgi:hypothetical protein